MEFQYFDVDNELMTYNELKDEKTKRKSKRNRNKDLAEFQFNVSAKPIKLKDFFQDMIDLQPDVPDETVELNGNEDVAPMIFQPNIFPSNTEELAVEVLDTANNLLEIDENEEFALNTSDTTGLIKDINQKMVQIKTASIVSNADKFSLDFRHQGPTLTAKRFSVKALQLFSFNENYKKHFTYDVDKLRELNTDMLIDQSLESVKWLNYLGDKYQAIYLKMMKNDVLQPTSDELILKLMTPDNPYFKALGFSTILKHVTFNDLQQLKSPLNNLAEFYDQTYYRVFTLELIFKFFGLKVFGHDPMLNFQLNYLHLIPYYLKENKKKRIYSIFSDIDFTIRKP